MSNEHVWGATPEDWSSLSLVAGLTAHLLPVVSNPAAKVSPDSKLKKLGKVPSLYNNSGEVVGIGKWPEKQITDRDIDRWRNVADYGICIQTRHLRALDIDIADEYFAQMARNIFGQPLVPVRFRANSGKILLAFYLDGDFTKRILTTEGGQIEFLANGQQFVAVGTHQSGVRYEWMDPSTGIVGLPGDFPTLTREQFESGWAALSYEMGTEEVIEFSQGRALKEQRRAVDVVDDTAVFLKANGWVKSTSRDGRLNIRCPFEADHSGPSADDTATQYMPAGVGGFQQGHFHCLHAHCAGRGDHEYLDVLGVVDEMFDIITPEPPVPGAPPDPPSGLQRKADGSGILTNLVNVVVSLRAAEWIGVEIGLDRFRDGLMIRQGGSKTRDGWRSFTDADYSRIRLALHSRGIRSPGAELVKDAVALVAEENGFDSAIEWLTGVVPKWDGVERVSHFYRDAFGVEEDDDGYVQACGRYTWTALAARVLEPGCKADMVPILKGEQGIRKSEAIAAMAPAREFFCELDLAAHDDNMSRMMRGRLVVEFGELRGLHTKDQEAIKSFITRRWETWVPKYREFATSFPRRCLFFGTTNKDQVLADPTGNRRWLPMECTKASTEWIEANRMQLWAEARQMFTEGGILYEEAERLAKGRHAAYMMTDTWDRPIKEWLGVTGQGVDEGGKHLPVRISEILHGALGFEARNVSRIHEMRVADVLKALGYERRKIRRFGELGWFWMPKVGGVL